ncbi:hypothetical protein FH589_17585 [Leptospira interrogans]|nr:hypothetical protein [Leptospira interrogans]ULG81062.1 hypothetical protein FH595_03350 [Leptospira interrogans]UML68685.1 hypothetical protein FH589_17585 [Leptospira interrogans]UML72007.1 hypothetical protein FH598_15785 [Leptospira interrogans]
MKTKLKHRWVQKVFHRYKQILKYKTNPESDILNLTVSEDQGQIDR